MSVSKPDDSCLADGRSEQDPGLLHVRNRDPSNIKLVQPIARDCQRKHNASYRRQLRTAIEIKRCRSFVGRRSPHQQRSHQLPNRLSRPTLHERSFEPNVLGQRLPSTCRMYSSSHGGVAERLSGAARAGDSCSRQRGVRGARFECRGLIRNPAPARFHISSVIIRRLAPDGFVRQG